MSASTASNTASSDTDASVILTPTMTWDFNATNAHDLYTSTAKIAVSVADSEHTHNNRKLALTEGCYDFMVGLFPIDVLNGLKARIFKGLDRDAIVLPPEVIDFLTAHGIKEPHYNSVNPFGSVYEHFHQTARAAHKQLIASELVGDAAGIIETSTSPVSLASERYRYSTMLMAALDMGDRKVIRMPFTKMMAAYGAWKETNPHFGVKREKGTRVKAPLAVVAGTGTDQQAQAQDDDDAKTGQDETTRTPMPPRMAAADGREISSENAADGRVVSSDSDAKEYAANIVAHREAATMRISTMRKRIADLRAIEVPADVKAIIEGIANDLEDFLTQEEKDHTEVMEIVSQYT